MTTGWQWDPVRLRAALESLGYDVTADEAALAGDGGSLTARRDRASRAHLIVVDAGGRFRAEIAVAADAPVGTATVAGVPLRIVTETRRTTTITGLLVDSDQFLPLVAALDRLAPPLLRDRSGVGVSSDDGA